MNLGLYEKAAELQKPTTEAILSSTDSNRKGQENLASKLELVKKTIENEGELTRQNQSQNQPQNQNLALENGLSNDEDTE